MFKIGTFSKITNLTIRALHHYEELGILIPNKIDTITNYRYYSASQLATVNKIKILQQIGLPLKTIKILLESDDVELLEHYYLLQENKINKEIDELNIKQNLIKALKDDLIQNNYSKEYNVSLKQISKRKVISIRRTIPTFNDEHQVWSDLYAELIKQNVQVSNPPFGMTIYHDMEYVDTDIDIEVQINIDGNYNDTDLVKFYEASEFIMASITFNGSYDQMPSVTQALALWIEVNNYEICGPMINIPYVSPAQDIDPNNWITEAGYMVKVS